jgi:hypothetical protein
MRPMIHLSIGRLGIALAVLPLIASAGSSRAQDAQGDNFSLQARCANAARRFFNDAKSQMAENAHFENHYSIALQKCFIRMQEGPIFSQSKYGFTSVYVYDALESKLYAEYDGDAICNKENNHCLLNSGTIWFDANTSRNPPDVRVGYGGLMYGGAGGEDTKREFIVATDKYFMNN